MFLTLIQETPSHSQLCEVIGSIRRAMMGHLDRVGKETLRILSELEAGVSIYTYIIQKRM